MKIKRNLTGALFAVGASLGSIVAGVYGATQLGTKPPKRMRIDWEAKKKKKVRKTLGIIVDSSLTKKQKANFYRAMEEAQYKFKNEFNIEYFMEYLEVDIAEKEIAVNKLYSYVPQQFRWRDYSIVIMDGAVIGFEKSVGVCDRKKRMIFFPNFQKRDSSSDFHQVVIHEIAHSLGCEHNYWNNQCLMYPSASSNQNFCKPCIEKILFEK